MQSVERAIEVVSEVGRAAKAAAPMVPVILGLSCQPESPTMDAPPIPAPPLDDPIADVGEGVTEHAQSMRMEALSPAGGGSALEYRFALAGDLTEGITTGTFTVANDSDSGAYHQLPEGLVFQATSDGLPRGPYLVHISGSAFMVNPGQRREENMDLVICPNPEGRTPFPGASLTIEGELGPKATVTTQLAGITAAGQQADNEPATQLLITAFCEDVDFPRTKPTTPPAPHN